MTKESSVARVLLVLVFAPSGGLFGKAVADAAAGREWWPWLVAALVWLVLSGLVSVAVSSRLEDQPEDRDRADRSHGHQATDQHR